MPLRPVPLDQLVRDTVLRFLPRADAAGVDLGALGLEQAVTMQGQPLLIEGVLSNLIDNALRYGVPPAGEAPQVTVELAREDGSVVLSVLDNGPGIAPVQRQQLQQRWVQGRDGERLGQGAGLGLGIVARYAELLGARLEFTPGPQGRGLCARLVFAPLASTPGGEN